MDYRPLGNTGIELSALGIGCGRQGGLFVLGTRDEQLEAAKLAIDAGVNYFDTAASYGSGRSEENLGAVLRELGADVYVGTKISIDAHELAEAATLAPKRLREGLSRLGRDHVDVCHLHGRIRAGDQEGRFLAPADVCGEVASAMQLLKQQGLTRSVGFTCLGETDALKQVVSRGEFDTMQAYFGVLNPTGGSRGSAQGAQQDYEHLMADAVVRGIGVFAIRIYSAGALVGASPRHPRSGGAESATAAASFNGATYAGDVAEANRLAKLVQEYGLESVFELATRFVLSEPLVTTALGGFSDVPQVTDALRWIGRGPLPADLLATLDRR